MSTTPRTDAHVARLRLDPEASGCDQTLSFARQLETELAAMKAEFEKIILLAAQAADRNVELRRLAEKAEAELARFRALFPAICSALGNGACCTPDVSIGFLESIPNEVASVVSRLRAEVEAANKHCDILNESNSRACAEAERLNGYCEELHTIIDNHGYPSGIDYAKMEARAERAEAERDSLRSELAEAKVERETVAEASLRSLESYIDKLKQFAERAEKAEAECLEQARLLGKSGEREADLLGKLERLARDRARLDWLERRNNIAIDHFTWAEHMPLAGQQIIHLLEMDDDCEISLEKIATAPNLRAAIDAAMKGTP